jgi:hypothetical protein
MLQHLPKLKPRVDVSAPGWRTFVRFMLPFLGLAFCVFTWGLKYKLSLYDPPHAPSHAIPTAKLLSRNEQKAGTENPLISTSSAPQKAMQFTLPGLLLSLFFLAFSMLGRVLLDVKSPAAAEQPWRLCRRASLAAFFFRPPPTLA